jgi:hypothetical protein
MKAIQATFTSGGTSNAPSTWIPPKIRITSATTTSAKPLLNMFVPPGMAGSTPVVFARLPEMIHMAMTLTSPRTARTCRRIAIVAFRGLIALTITKTVPKTAPINIPVIRCMSRHLTGIGSAAFRGYCPAITPRQPAVTSATRRSTRLPPSLRPTTSAAPAHPSASRKRAYALPQNQAPFHPRPTGPDLLDRTIGALR